MTLLLDTCTFLWLITDAADLSAEARALLVDPDHELYLSAVSVWEIVLKHELGRLPLPEPPAQFLPRQRKAHAVRELPLSEGACLTLDRLPALHRDPFDRMLVCQAIDAGLSIVTPDPLINSYPVRCLW